MCIRGVCDIVYVYPKWLFAYAGNVPFYLQVIYNYNLWFIALAGMSMAGVLTLKKGLWCKISAFVRRALCYWRTQFSRKFVGMVCIAGILGVMICRYRHKLALFCVIFLVLTLFFVGFY